MENKARCLISETNDPFFNLATEDWIFKDLNPEQQTLFLWRNDKSVIIGRNQNPWSECNIKKIEEDNVNLVRRQSGGGAVYQDLGNSIFTFLSSKESYDKKRNFQIIINALKKFGIEAEQSGRNDILVNGKKISGSAFKENKDRAFHHGTLMINVNLNELEQYLTPSQKKLISKGTTSVRSRVANIKEFHYEMSHDLLMDAIIEEFFKTYNSEKNIEILNHESLKKIPELNEYYEFLKSSEWRFGESPSFTHHLHERFNWGTIDLHLDIENGIISKSKLFSDCLDTELIEKLELSMKNTEYNSDEIKNKFEKLKLENSNQSEQINEFQNWMISELNK